MVGGFLGACKQALVRRWRVSCLRSLGGVVLVASSCVGPLTVASGQELPRDQAPWYSAGNEPYVLGTGWQQDRNQSRGACLRFRRQVVTAGGRLELYLQQALLPAEVDAKLFGENPLDALTSWGRDIAASREAASLKADRATTHYYLASYTNSWQQVVDPILSGVAATWLPEERRQRCGDSYVAAIATGGLFLVQLEWQFPGPDDKFWLGKLLLDRRPGLSELSQGLADLEGVYQGNFSLRLRVYQRGGDVAKALPLLAATGISLTCHYPDMGSCLTALAGVRSYLIDPDGWYDQLTIAEGATALPKDAVLAYRLASYDEEPLLATVAAGREAYERVLRQDIRDQAAARFIHANSSSALPVATARRLAASREVLAENQALTAATLKACRNLADCVAAYQNFAKAYRPLMRGSIGLPWTFLDWCRSQVPSVAVAKTLRALRKIAGEDDCQDAFWQLEQRASLNLAHLGLQNLEPLVGLGQLTSLDASHNSLSDTGWLSYLPQLTRLNLNQNRISKLDLGEVTALKRLEINGNQIDRWSSLQSPQLLEFLSIVGNPIASLAPPGDFLSPKTLLWTKPRQVCDAEGAKAVARRQVAAQAWRRYQEVGFAPVKPHGAKEIIWLPCEAAYQLF